MCISIEHSKKASSISKKKASCYHFLQTAHWKNTMSKNFEALRHATKIIPGGGKVLILDTGAIISPEAEAMLQALYSRSIAGIEEHLKVLATQGPEKFMSTYYVGYGHKSIGDCGTGTVFIEGVSMLVAKAIQAWQLYSGQESSTRYIDFSSQPFIDPLNTDASKRILDAWRAFYLKGLAMLPPHLMERFPIQEGENPKVYKKAIEARAFDIMRSFLPAGAATNLSWHSNLRQMADKLVLLRHHPLKEVRTIAEAMEDALIEMFPSSFSEQKDGVILKKRYPATEEYAYLWMMLENYYSAEQPPDFALTHFNVDVNLLSQSAEILGKRPPKTELPKYLAECGTLQFEFMLDFGSFRDIQRHRSVTQRMPLLTTKHRFAPWYLTEFPKDFQMEAYTFLFAQERALRALDASPEVKQYYTAMGYNLPNRLTGDIPALVYLVELRATRFVHPTLRARARQMAEVLTDCFGDIGLVLHLDTDPDRFDVKRGTHDIVKKK